MQELEKARQLILEKRYDEARMLLEELNHPIARKWLVKIDEIADRNPPVKTSGQLVAKNTNKKSSNRGYSPILVTLVASILFYLIGLGSGAVLFGKSTDAKSNQEALVPSLTQTASATSTPSVTWTPSSTATPSVTPTASATRTPLPTATPSATITPSATLTPQFDPVDAQRAKNLVRERMQNSAIIRFGEEDIFNYFYYGPLALGSHWEIGDYSVNFDSVGRYSVSIPVKYVFMCTPDTGLDETGCAEYFANEMGWEMPNCTAEWLVILDTQEIVQMNDCADILFDQLPSN